MSARVPLHQIIDDGRLPNIGVNYRASIRDQFTSLHET